MDVRPPDYTTIYGIHQALEGADLGPNTAEIIEKLDYFFKDLENNVWRPEITGSYWGAITPSVSTPWHVKRGAVLKEFRILLGTAGASDTTVVCKKNGSVVATVTLGSGATAGSDFIDVGFLSDTDVLEFEITVAGSGAENLSAIARFI